MGVTRGLSLDAIMSNVQHYSITKKIEGSGSFEMVS